MLSVIASSASTNMALQKAILVYGPCASERYGDSNDQLVAHATVNDVDMSSGHPVVMPGRLVTQADLKALASGLAQSQALTSPAWIDLTMLALGAGRMVWYSPPVQRSLFFTESGHSPEHSFTGKGIAPIPGLVWMVNRGCLFVFAYKGAGRPTKETLLYQAPFFNVWSQGKVCNGNAQMPSNDGVDQPQAWMDSFFGSYFTHVNFTEKDRLVKGVNPVSFWKSSISKPLKSFPERVLVELSITVGDLVSSEVDAKLSTIRKAQGEF